MRSRLIAAAVALLSLTLPATARAWGGEGHRVVARLAYERLTPTARAEIDRVIAGARAESTPACPVASVEDAATWADCVRGQRDPVFSRLTPLHFEDRPLCGSETKASFCPEGQCVSEELKRALAVLRDRRRSDVDRLVALEEVEHFTGDMHQPLHMTDNADRGGNQVPVRYPGEGQPTSLHHVWDTELVVAALGAHEKQAEAALRPAIDQSAPIWSRGDVNAWAAETHLLGTSFVYPRLPSPPACGRQADLQDLGPVYIRAAAPLVRQQLGRAAARLAVLLNAALR